MYVCVCAAVTDSQIVHEMKSGASFRELQKTLNVARQCCSCARTIHEMIKVHDKYPHGSSPTN